MYYRDVRRRAFGAGDLVLHKVVENTQEINAAKLAPTWEGPYRITAIAGSESILSGGLGRKTTSLAVECSQFKEVLH